MAVDEPVISGRVRLHRAALVQKQRAAHGIKPVKAAPQVVFVVAGGLHHGQVDAGAVDAQPADEVGVLLIKAAVAGQDLSRAGGRGLDGAFRRCVGLRVGLLGLSQCVPRGSQRLNAHMGGPRCNGDGGGCAGQRGGCIGLAAAEYTLPQGQHGGQKQCGGTGDAQCPRMAALARPQPGAGGEGVVRGIPAQLAVAFGHSGDSFRRNASLVKGRWPGGPEGF